MAYKAELRQVLIKALANKRLGNQMMDAIVELQSTLNNLITLLEDNKADITAVDFASLLIGDKLEN